MNQGGRSLWKNREWWKMKQVVNSCGCPFDNLEVIYGATET